MEQRRSMFTGLLRPNSANNRTRPMPLVSKGLGGNTASIAPKSRRAQKGPENTKIFRKQPKRSIPPTTFRRFYLRGDLPVQVSFNGANRKLSWKVSLDMLDFHHYLPIFFEGLRELDEPYKFIANKGIDDMLEACPHKVLSVLPQIILPIKSRFYIVALNTKYAEVIVNTIKKLQAIAKCGNGVGESLVPYYRQILPVFNMFKNKRVNLGDHIEYGQYKNSNISDLIQETLELFEISGGEDAYINIKYMIPTYESCMF